mmetsp:Transcript_2958/g.8328  ORF Transcript_2958/g.8328 Transcript_2958/m.8328 type:complete len:214 (-) Transcript_2958:360-1001(-)
MPGCGRQLLLQRVASQHSFGPVDFWIPHGDGGDLLLRKHITRGFAGDGDAAWAGHRDLDNEGGPKDLPHLAGVVEGGRSLHQGCSHCAGLAWRRGRIAPLNATGGTAAGGVEQPQFLVLRYVAVASCHLLNSFCEDWALWRGAPQKLVIWSANLVSVGIHEVRVALLAVLIAGCVGVGWAARGKPRHPHRFWRAGRGPSGGPRSRRAVPMGCR